MLTPAKLNRPAKKHYSKTDKQLRGKLYITFSQRNVDVTEVYIKTVTESVNLLKLTIIKVILHTQSRLRAAVSGMRSTVLTGSLKYSHRACSRLLVFRAHLAWSKLRVTFPIMSRGS